MMDMSPLLATEARFVGTPATTEKPSISVVGLGYVGAVSTACLSSLHHTVVGVDIDPTKTECIAQGRSPIHEQDLGELLADGVAAGRISTTANLTQAVIDTNVTFVSVGTPTAEDGGCDDRYIRIAAEQIGLGLRGKDDFHVVVMRCSIPPGTTLGVMTPILEEVSGKKAGVDFGVAFNPEFLREGVAVADFYAPPKTVVGSSDPKTAAIMTDIYAPVDDVIETSIEVAEMVKYVDNVWHATKVVFGNEVGRLCKPMGVDSHDVMDIFCQDTKLNLSPYYLKPGFAYGGSCLPKEVRAVSYIANKAGVDLPLVRALEESNTAHIARATEMVRETGAKKVAVLGLAFKAGTDDLRESPILEVIADLREDGTELSIHDQAITTETPLAGQLAYVAHGSPGLAALATDLPEMLADNLADALADADAVIVTHDAAEYRAALSLHPDLPVIDVVRLFKTPQTEPDVRGIAW